MPTLIITRGLPGSGKTTRARAWVAQDPKQRARVNRDDLRAMLHAGVWLGHETEQQIMGVRDGTIAGLLRRGVDVVCDDTNLPQRIARDLAALAARCAAELEVWDLTDVPVQECIARDAARDRVVGAEVILDLHARYLAGKRYPLPVPQAPAAELGTVPAYTPVAGTPKAVMVDEDGPNAAVIAAVRAMHAAGYAVVFCSGRTEASRAATERWLHEHVAVPYEALYMRPVGDQRRDSVVKAELFDRHIRHAYDVLAVFDDRQQVVDAWRALGLTVFQVAPGDF
jgi:predicted kinase